MLKKHNKQFVVGLALSLILVVFGTASGLDKAKFAVITDPHLALHKANDFRMFAASIKIFESTLKTINKMDDLDFVVVNGDLLLDGEPWNLDLGKAYLDELRVPYYVVCGNHDYASAKQAKPGGSPYVAISKATFIWCFQGHGFKGPNGWWGADPMPWLHLIGLDSTVPTGPGGHISLTQMKFLDSELRGNQNKTNIIFAHHNFVPWSKREEPGQRLFSMQADNAPEVRKIVEKYVPASQVVISGHRHIGLRYKNINDVNYIVCPATVSYPNQYTIFTLTPKGITYETKWVPVDKSIIEEAKARMVKAFRLDENKLKWLEGPGGVLKKGTIELKPIGQ